MNQEITAEFTREELGTPSPDTLRILPIAKFAARSDMGKVRENNEDKFDFFEPDDEAALASRGSVYIVCDGMGGHEAGQIASELACKSFLFAYYHSAGSPQEAARRALLHANDYIYQIGESVPSRKGMGTTLTALILLQDQAIIAHAGDSRCYRFQSGRLEQLTTDHTMVNEWVKQGVLTYETARYHPYAHVLTQAVGVQETLQPDVETIPLLEGDLFLLCSDGLTEHLEDTDILEILTVNTPSKAVLALVDQALAGGGRDNVTVTITQVKELRAQD